MRKIISLLLLISSFSVEAQTRNPFSNLKFDKVIMYDFEGGKESDLAVVDTKGKLISTIRKQTILDKETILKLNSRLGEKKSYGGSTAACFDPHLGFVYYQKEKVVVHVTICLDCNRLVSSITIPAQKQGKVGKGEDAYYIADGLSLSFRKFLNQLLVRNDFSHQLKK